jgi:hypothetical protein
MKVSFMAKLFPHISLIAFVRMFEIIGRAVNVFCQINEYNFYYQNIFLNIKIYNLPNSYGHRRSSVVSLVPAKLKSHAVRQSSVAIFFSSSAGIHLGNTTSQLQRIYYRMIEGSIVWGEPVKSDY